MKCQNCGGEMDSGAIRCPYCNSENTEGIIFRQQVQKKLERYKFLKPFILKKKTPEMVSAYMTRLLLILAGVNVLLWVFSFLIYLAGERFLQPQAPEEGTYASHFADFNEGNFYVEMNRLIEAIQKKKLPSEYDIEQVIQYGFRNLETESELLEPFLTDYLGLTEEEMQYLYEYPKDRYYLDRDWLEKTSRRVLSEMEGNVE